MPRTNIGLLVRLENVLTQAANLLDELAADAITIEHCKAELMMLGELHPDIAEIGAAHDDPIGMRERVKERLEVVRQELRDAGVGNG